MRDRSATLAKAGCRLSGLHNSSSPVYECSITYIYYSRTAVVIPIAEILTALHSLYMRSFLLCFAFSRLAALGSQMSAPGGNAITVRDAVIEDLDQITEIGISSFPLDPQWNYRYPYREQYPKVHYDCCRQRWEEWLAASRTPDCMILVVEGPSDENGLVKKVLAFSIWKMPSHLSDEGDKYKSLFTTLL